MRKLSKNLLNKSRESFLLSLELFNKPTIGYRIESFSLLFTNAWELLLKVYIYEKSNGDKSQLFYNKIKNQKRKTITLDDCLKKVFNENDPVRKNIEYISEIRNESAHLVISELEPYFSRVFQSGVLNYIEFILSNFQIDLINELNPGFISLVSREKDIKNITLLKNRMTKEDLENVKSWVDKFHDLEKMGKKATIPLEYKIAIVNNPKKADITLYSGKSSGGVLPAAIIIEKNKDPDQTHPYLASEALSAVNNSLGNANLTTYDFQAYCYFRGIKKTAKNDYFWSSRHASSKYSEKLVSEMISYYESDKEGKKRMQIREKYKNRKSSI